MADKPTPDAGEETPAESTIDYGASQADIDKAKQAAHDADRERLAEESKPS